MNYFIRSRKGTGFDYWIGNQNDEIFANQARLEVSGIRNGDDAKMRSRLREKQAQIDGHPSQLTGYVVIVEFSMPKAFVNIRRIENARN